MIDNTNEATIINVCLNINTEITFPKYAQIRQKTCVKRVQFNTIFTSLLDSFDSFKFD